MQQLAGAGRRGFAAKLFNVSGCASGNWMYDSKCVLNLDAHALVALMRRRIPQVQVPRHNATDNASHELRRLCQRTSRMYRGG